MCVYTTFCLSFHLSVTTRVVSTFWLLWIMLLWTWVYTYLFEFLLSIPLGIYPEVELLDHVVILCLTFWGTTKLFLSCIVLHSHQQCTRFLIFPYPHQHLLFSLIWMIAILMGMSKNFNIYSDDSEVLLTIVRNQFPQDSKREQWPKAVTYKRGASGILAIICSICFCIDIFIYKAVYIFLDVNLFFCKICGLLGISWNPQIWKGHNLGALGYVWAAWATPFSSRIWLLKFGLVLWAVPGMNLCKKSFDLSYHFTWSFALPNVHSKPQHIFKRRTKKT